MVEVFDTYKTIEAPAEGIYKEKGSKFIAKAFPVKTEEQVKSIIDQVKEEYYDARHHCYAYILGPKGDKWRANDDGEPSGTAGKPIHGQLLSFNLTNVLVVVIRYFGGKKLGVSGLINAYKTAAHDALANAKIFTRTVDAIYRVTFGYTMINKAMRLVKDLNLQIVAQQFDNTCFIRVRIRRSMENEFLSKCSKIEGLIADFEYED
ncbi:MAG TPA: YigZ family protein [Bacteroidales bacterium]|nr:YigZ family protein [Bacteroidales bacterium]